MFRVFNKIDDLEVVINTSDIVNVQDMGDHRLICTIYDEFEIKESINEIFIFNQDDIYNKFIPIKLSSS